MNPQSMIILYESIADLTHQMLVAANNKDWDKLVDIESHCTTYVEKFKECEAQVMAMTEVERAHQISLIQQILRDNRRIRELIEPNMQTLSSMIKNTSNERKLAKTYNVNPGD